MEDFFNRADFLFLFFRAQMTLEVLANLLDGIATFVFAGNLHCLSKLGRSLFVNFIFQFFIHLWCFYHEFFLAQKFT